MAFLPFPSNETRAAVDSRDAHLCLLDKNLIGRTNDYHTCPPGVQPA
jgi:hypothetical protein